MSLNILQQFVTKFKAMTTFHPFQKYFLDDTGCNLYEVLLTILLYLTNIALSPQKK